MAKPLQEELAQFHAGICQALADTTRIAILYELSEGPKNVSQLVEALGNPQATVSRHLKVLRERGTVNSERDGVHVYYSLADQRIIEALDLLRGVMTDILAQRRRLAEALKARPSRRSDPQLNYR
jgi:DNA-binding transcriptional ArsR family regulator